MLRLVTLLAFVSGLACTGKDPLGGEACGRFVDKPDDCPFCVGVELHKDGTGESFNHDVEVSVKWTVEDDEVVVTTPMNERRYRIAEDGGLVGPDEYMTRHERRPCE